MAYQVEINRASQKQILSLLREAQVEIAEAIDGLAVDPSPIGCKKLRGTELWRVRVGRYRAIYVIDDKARVVTVVKVGIRRENTYESL